MHEAQARMSPSTWLEHAHVAIAAWDASLAQPARSDEKKEHACSHPGVTREMMVASADVEELVTARAAQVSRRVELRRTYRAWRGA